MTGWERKYVALSYRQWEIYISVPWRAIWEEDRLCRIQEKLPPSRLHLTSSKALLTFKSWASWLVLKKKCQVIIDRNFCQGKMNTWNLYYPQGRAATAKRHLQNNSFLLLVYWSYHMLTQPPLPFAPLFSYKFLGQSCQGHCLITLGLDQSCRSKEECKRTSFLTVPGIKPQATSQDHRHQAMSHRPHRRHQLSSGR